jgi:vancomycin resistance protein YoaR
LVAVVSEGRARTWLRRSAQVLGIVIGVTVALVGIERLVFYNRILPRVDVDGTEVDGAVQGDARREIEDLAARLETETIVATVGDRELHAEPEEIGLTMDAAATYRAARDTGRADLAPWEQVTETVERIVTGTDVPLAVRWDDAELERVLDRWAPLSIAGLEPGDVRVEGTTPVVVEPAAGTGMDRDAARAVLQARLRTADRRPIELPDQPVQPALTAADVQRVADQASALLAAPKDVVRGPLTITVTPEQLAAALTTTRAADGTGLQLRVDPFRLAGAMGESTRTFDAAPVDATFAVNADNSVSVVPSQDGLTLGLASLAGALVTQPGPIEAPMAPFPPARDTAWAEALGIKEQVSTFTTEHACCAARVDNIHRAADLMNNTIVEPGQVFSLNDTVGPRTGERGFREAPVYYEGFTTDFGGGVSQLSTTVYNAAWWGGFEIVEHQPHSIWITRYPAGREATLNYGTIDNKFRNDTQHGILIRTSYTGTSITVTIYGDREGKVVREENREVTSGVQAAGRPFTVRYDRVIERPGQEPVRETWRWRYQQSEG